MQSVQSPSHPSRRLLLALAGALPVAAVPVVASAEPAGDDAELLALVRQFHQHDATIRQFDQARGIPDDVFEAELSHWWQALDRVAETPAQTGAGIAAKLSMLRAVHTNDISKEHPRRFALIAGLADDAARGTPMPPVAPEADAELIRLCHQFAETEFEDWYQYTTAPADEADDLPYNEDWAEDLRRITDIPATTPAGWCAKALVYAAWDREAYDCDPVRAKETDPQGSIPLLSSLLREMVAPARNAILDRLRATYGPLPHYYTPDGRWLGPDHPAFIAAVAEARRENAANRAEAGS